MKANYNVTGKERKALVAAIAAITGDKAVYKFMPTCAYEIGDITVDKEGGVTCEDADKLERLIHNLIADGFTPAEEIESTNEEATAEEPETDEGTGLTVSLPLEKAAVGNLTNLLTAKESLIKKALGIETASAAPNKTKVGKLTKAQVEEIAKLKLPDLNCTSLESAMSMIKGTARSMGVTVEE